MSRLPSFAGRTSSTYDDLSTPSKPVIEKIDVSTPESLLPTPAVQFSPVGGKRRCKRRTRIKESAARGLQIQWQRLLRRFGAGVLPSGSSVEVDTESVGEASAAHGYFKPDRQRMEVEETDYVDEVVVDREWGSDVRTSSEHSAHGERTGSGHHHPSSDVDSVAASHDDTRGTNPVVAYLRYRLWAAFLGFFLTKFEDERSEDQYRKETWFLRKVRPSQPIDVWRN